MSAPRDPTLDRNAEGPRPPEQTLARDCKFTTHNARGSLRSRPATTQNTWLDADASRCAAANSEISPAQTDR